MKAFDPEDAHSHVQAAERLDASFSFLTLRFRPPSMAIFARRDHLLAYHLLVLASRRGGGNDRRGLCSSAHFPTCEDQPFGTHEVELGYYRVREN
jgi:hypothetical protein